MLGFTTKNKYTINHYNYNKLGLLLIIKLCGLIIFGYTSQSNCGYKFRYKCMEYTFYGFLVTLRLVATLYLLIIIPYEIGLLIGMTVTINSYNWWDYKNEKSDKNYFVTNVSMWNSFCCWIGWFFMYFVILVLVMMTLVLIINIIKMFSRLGCWFSLKKICRLIKVSLKTFSI